MKRFMTWFFLLVLLTSNAVSAQTTRRSNVNVGATVGEFFITITGFVSPNASLVLTSDDTLLRSGTANSVGYFSMSQVRIKRGFSEFCITAIDFKRLGESLSCVQISPATGSITIHDIFLPPTIGVFSRTVNAGDEGIVHGYSMPNTTVRIKINKTQTITVQTDATGFYRYVIPNMKAGDYSFLASATYNGIPSLEPKKGVEIKALSPAEQVTQTTGDTLKNLWAILLTSGLIFFLTIGGLVGLIIFLLVRVHPWWLVAFYKRRRKKEEQKPTSPILSNPPTLK